ncbi:hypothetical protein [Hyphococcus sp. DH-69]
MTGRPQAAYKRAEGFDLGARAGVSKRAKAGTAAQGVGLVSE